MLTFREIQNCEGYYYQVRSGSVWRVVGPGEASCGAGGSGEPPSLVEAQDTPEFELLTSDVNVPFAAVQRQVQERYGCGPTEFHNRQTARQPDGSMVTEEAETELNAEAEAQQCRTSI